MNTNKLFSALAYLSIFFLGFIFPAVLYFVADDGEVKRHAKAAFLSHCIPVAAIFIAFLFVFALGFRMDGMGAGRMIGLLVIMGLAGLVSLAVTIWNVVKAVQILTR